MNKRQLLYILIYGVGSMGAALFIHSSGHTLEWLYPPVHKARCFIPWWVFHLQVRTNQEQNVIVLRNISAIYQIDAFAKQSYQIMSLVYMCVENSTLLWKYMAAGGPRAQAQPLGPLWLCIFTKADKCPHHVGQDSLTTHKFLPNPRWDSLNGHKSLPKNGGKHKNKNISVHIIWDRIR